MDMAGEAWRLTDRLVMARPGRRGIAVLVNGNSRQVSARLGRRGLAGRHLDGEAGSSWMAGRDLARQGRAGMAGLGLARRGRLGMAGAARIGMSIAACRGRAGSACPGPAGQGHLAGRGMAWQAGIGRSWRGKNGSSRQAWQSVTRLHTFGSRLVRACLGRPGLARHRAAGHVIARHGPFMAGRATFGLARPG